MCIGAVWDLQLPYVNTHTDLRLKTLQVLTLKDKICSPVLPRNLTPLSPNINIQILQTDFHTFP